MNERYEPFFDRTLNRWFVRNADSGATVACADRREAEEFAVVSQAQNERRIVRPIPRTPIL